jgi:hypothetical protein
MSLRLQSTSCTSLDYRAHNHRNNHHPQHTPLHLPHPPRRHPRLRARLLTPTATPTRLTRPTLPRRRRRLIPITKNIRRPYALVHEAFRQIRHALVHTETIIAARAVELFDGRRFAARAEDGGCVGGERAGAADGAGDVGGGEGGEGCGGAGGRGAGAGCWGGHFAWVRGVEIWRDWWALVYV